MNDEIARKIYDNLQPLEHVFTCRSGISVPNPNAIAVGADVLIDHFDETVEILKEMRHKFIVFRDPIFQDNLKKMDLIRGSDGFSVTINNPEYTDLEKANRDRLKELFPEEGTK